MLRKPFKKAITAIFVAMGWTWGACEHNRAKRLERKLAEYEPPHTLPCEPWTERVQTKNRSRPEENNKALPAVLTKRLADFSFLRKCSMIQLLNVTSPLLQRPRSTGGPACFPASFTLSFPPCCSSRS
jgi:hypothetical protein